MTSIRTLSVPEFHAELKAQGVSHQRHYALKCASCGTVQSMASLVAAGATPEEAERKIGFSCEGRLTNAGPWPSNPSAERRATRGCDWSLGGFFRIHKLEVITPDGEKNPRFEIASPEEAQALEAEIAPKLVGIGIVDADDARRLNGIEALRRLSNQIDDLVTAAGPVDNGTEWEKLYDMIFGPLKLEANTLLKANGLTFPDYCDPDTTYGEDAMAWITAFREVAKPFLDANPAKD